jgi:hypothetical protein
LADVRFSGKPNEGRERKLRAAVDEAEKRVSDFRMEAEVQAAEAAHRRVEQQIAEFIQANSEGLTAEVYESCGAAVDDLKVQLERTLETSRAVVTASGLWAPLLEHLPYPERRVTGVPILNDIDALVGCVAGNEEHWLPVPVPVHVRSQRAWQRLHDSFYASPITDAEGRDEVTA